MDIVKYLCDKQNGYIQELEKELSPETVRELEAMGYIVSAPSAHMDTWRVSKRAIQINKMMNRKPSIMERIRDFLYTRVYKVDFGL